MKAFSTEHIFTHPWDRVTMANWTKYPSDLTPHVLSVDYLSRSVDPATGTLLTERLLTCKQAVPAFLSRLLGVEHDCSYVYEQSRVDPRGGTITLRSHNLTFSNVIAIEETCKYARDPADWRRTVFSQEARIVSFTGWSHLRDAVEDFCVTRFGVNAQKGRSALEDALERLLEGTKEHVRETLHFFDPDAKEAPAAACDDEK